MSETKTLQYRTDGPDGAPLIVLGPALGATWHMWDRQIPELTRHRRVLRFDFPGHGGAPAHPALSAAELAERLIVTFDALGVERFAYAGCSLGGAVGAELALAHPHRVSSLALLSSAPRYGTPDAWRQRGVVIRTNGLDPVARSTPERWFTPGFATAQPAIVDWAVQMVRTTDPGCYIAACEALAAFDIRDALPRIGVPALVVAGADDRVTPPSDARALVAGIPDARLALVPGASHLVPVEQPAAVTDLLVTHLGAETPGEPQRGTGRPQPVGAPPAVRPVMPPPPPVAVAELEAGASAGIRRDPYEAGLKVRREVLGDGFVDRALAEADDVTRDFEDFATRYAWGEVWDRPGIDRRTRSVVTLTALTAGGHLDELALHVRAALRNGLTPVEITEVLLHAGVYCGLPAARAAFAVARDVVREETAPEDDPDDA
ncbi:alpha/beta fold hydrolase [Streptomyces sp. DSM 42041]|uniref:Alpha/beta fold hydrolase n=1 Tax=Streptomyces hazeniae TaxID=3075538 RepID=A0ABU2NWJ1_9ACTN|nr:alpha/beta fold hydrolase [Streptomyces sp. DSM 42041]MDT0380357.1 alpha/beta fold hydrolase [Streptomyces sp. DSM 42041]